MFSIKICENINCWSKKFFFSKYFRENDSEVFNRHSVNIKNNYVFLSSRISTHIWLRFSTFKCVTLLIRIRNLGFIKPDFGLGYSTFKCVNLSIRADAGYAISWSTLRRFVEEKFPDSNSCEAGGQYWKNGDWHLGKHLRELGIKPMDTRDHAGKWPNLGSMLKNSITAVIYGNISIQCYKHNFKVISP